MLIGGLVGAGELVSRYRDAPFSALGRGPSLGYLAINAVAAGAAFLVVKHVPSWRVGDNTFTKAISEVLLAGFGAMVVFRSSVFMARIGDKDVAVGPAVLLQAVVNAADAGVDRETATQRAPRVQHIMQHVDADKARYTLPRLCRSLLQSSMPVDEYTAMKQRVDDGLKKEDSDTDELPSEVKSYILGLILANYVGEGVLEEAVRMLTSEEKLVPKLTTGGDITKEATDEQGAVVEYQVSAEDHQHKPLEPLCSPPSGSKFPIGETEVECVAVHDATGLATKDSFTVTVEKLQPRK